MSYHVVDFESKPCICVKVSVKENIMNTRILVCDHRCKISKFVSHERQQSSTRMAWLFGQNAK